METPEFIKNIDWVELRKQKMGLLTIIEWNKLPLLTNDLNGIVHLIDSIQDYAVDNLGMSGNEVFGDLEPDFEDMYQTCQHGLKIPTQTKYLFIHLRVREGEREHDHKILHTTQCTNTDFAAEYYAAHFWGDDAERYDNDDSWYACGGEICITLHNYKELTEEEYNFLKKFLEN